MHCHVCGQEAVERCFNCGQLFCPQHGKVNCIRCETGFMPGDRRADRFTAVPVASSVRPAWWRPQEAEDFDPPACYECQALARLRCRDCGSLYCSQHAGKRGICRACQHSSRAGSIMLLLLFLGFGCLLLASYLYG